MLSRSLRPFTWRAHARCDGDPRLRKGCALGGPWAAPSWCHRTGTKERRGGSGCADTSHPLSTLSPLCCTKALLHPGSSLFSINLFQRASSKQVYTRHRREITAHNHQAPSLSFQSSFLKHGDRGGTRGERDKNRSTFVPGFGDGRCSAGRAPGFGQATAVQRRPPVATRSATHTTQPAGK